MGEHDISSGMLYVSADGQKFEPLGIVHNFNMEAVDTDISPEFSETKIIKPIDTTFSFKLKTKHNRKTFKKWLMSRGVCRDVAEGICRLVGILGGSVTYESLYFYILTGGLNRET